MRLTRIDDGATIAEIDGRPQGKRSGHGAARMLRFSNDSTMLAVGTNSGAVRLFDASDGRELAVGRHSRPITSIAFDSRDRRLLTGSRDQTARLWQLERDAADGSLAMNEIGVMIGHTGPVRCVAFDPTDQLAVTGTGMPDGELRVFDVGSGRTPGNEAIHRYEVGAQVDQATFANGGRRVLAIAGGRAMVWNFGTGRGVVTLRQQGAVPAACFANDGRRLVTAGDDERLRLWHTRDGRQIWTTDALGNPIQRVDVDARSERVACAMVGGLVQMHRLRDGAELYELRGHTGRVSVVRFLGDGSRLLTAGSEDTPGTATASGKAIVWSTNDQSPLATLERPQSIVAADLDASGTLLVTAEGTEPGVRLWRLDEQTSTFRAAGAFGDHTGAIRHVRFSPDGKRVLTASEDRSARLYAIAGERLMTFAATAPLRIATFSPDGAGVLTCGAGRNGTAQLWRAADGEEVLHFDGHRGSIEWGTFNSTGEWIATCARDRTTCIWPTDPVAAARRLPLRTRPTPTPVDTNR